MPPLIQQDSRLLGTLSWGQKSLRLLHKEAKVMAIHILEAPWGRTTFPLLGILLHPSFPGHKVQVLTQQMSRNRSPEVDKFVPIALMQCAADVSMEVQVEGL